MIKVISLIVVILLQAVAVPMSSAGMMVIEGEGNTLMMDCHGSAALINEISDAHCQADSLCCVNLVTLTSSFESVDVTDVAKDFPPRFMLLKPSDFQFDLLRPPQR